MNGLMDKEGLLRKSFFWEHQNILKGYAMPPELRKAHHQNDMAVMKVYGFY